MKTIRTLGILAIILVPLLLLSGCVITQSNHEVSLRNQFNQKLSERTAFYDKMWKTISQKSQITLKNDSSYQNVINSIMSGRKDAQGTFMKWIQESNPNQDFKGSVTAMYQDLSRTVEAQRDGFFEQEKVLQDIKLQHDNLLGQFPSSVMMTLLNRQPLVYKPITSDQTDEVIKTGKDNNTKLF